METGLEPGRCDTMTAFTRHPPAPAWRWPVLLVAAAGAALALGVAVYTTGRAGFGPLGGWLPTWAHTFAFSLLTAAVLPPRSAARYGGCAVWCTLNLAFEIGQHPQLGGPLAQTLQAGFGNGAPVRRLAAYFVHGSFDRMDLLAALAGALMAAAALTQAPRGMEAQDAT